MFPVCSQCKLSQQKAKCNVSDKILCGMVICRKCFEKNGAKICSQQGCKKLYKQHNFKLNIDVYKQDLTSKFQKQFKIRNEWQELVQKKQIDMDMVHILAALAYENRQTYDSHTKKQMKRLVEQIRTKKNTIETQAHGRKLPIFIRTISKQRQTNDGSQACGYIKNNYSAGFEQIINCFREI